MGVTLPVAFLGGLAFFFSPCVWPLYPAYVGYLAGVGSGAPGGTDSADHRAAARARRWVILRQALAFVVGFSIVFIALGATASAIGQLLFAYQEPFRKVGGLVIIVFGIFLLGVLPAWMLGSERRIARPTHSPTPAAAVLMGGAFAFGWTPCVGPILAGILVLTSVTASVAQGTLALAAYSLGLAVPFLLVALFLDRIRPIWSRIGSILPWVQRASGAALIVIGVMVFTGSFANLARWLYIAF